MEDDDNVIFSYTRKQAIEDGVLVDVTHRQGGELKSGGKLFYASVVMTASVWADVNNLPMGFFDVSEEDKVPGRTFDILSMARNAIHPKLLAKDNYVYTADFKVTVGTEELDLYIHAGPGDDGEPVFTIMQIGED